jgi:hypothetical protein
MSGQAATAWSHWAQQLPALGMILAFLLFAGKKLLTTLTSISDNCHATQREGHAVIKAATTAIGEGTESNRETRKLLVEVKTLLIKKNGGGG